MIIIIVLLFLITERKKRDRAERVFFAQRQRRDSRLRP